MEDKAAATLVRGTRHSYVRNLYADWVQGSRLGPADIKHLWHEANRFRSKPLISILLPVYNPKREWLEQALDSVLAQIYPHWELCVVDDSSTQAHVQEVLSLYERVDSRIKTYRMESNGGISAASNAGFEMANGEFVGLLDHDDELPPDALFQVARLLQDNPSADLIYSDVDKIDEMGERSDPNFKPGWSPDLLMSSNYISHLGIYRSSIFEGIGGFRSEFDGCQDYDLVLRFTEQTQRILHIPKVLYHWRTVEGSVASSPTNKSYIAERAHQALYEALHRRGLRGSVEDGLLPNRFRVKLQIEDEPKVSVITTGGDVSLLGNCLESIKKSTEYRNYEILIVDNESDDSVLAEHLSPSVHRVIRSSGEINHSRTNNLAAREATGEYLLFLNGNTEVISEGWMEEMLRNAQRSEVGAVGGKLLYPDGRILHSGIVTGVGHTRDQAVAAHSHQGYPKDSAGYVGAAKVTRNYSAVTSACMMVRRDIFEEIEGFDEENLPIDYNDVDLCLRMRERGYLIVYTPFVELYHHAPMDRRLDLVSKEIAYMRRHWSDLLDEDPYYNSNFSLGDASFNLRADLSRPKILRRVDERLETILEHSQAASDDEASMGVAEWELNARNSRYHSLVPSAS